jgi:DNA topoisomerase-1
MSTLVIVESPGKIKKIKSYLGPTYIVMASIGHIRDLAKNSISVDITNNFNPIYEINSDKKTVVSNLKKVAKECDNIIIASDGDREGEAIAFHLIEVLNIKDYQRIVFHEITKSAITKALNEPKLVDMNMFYSQQTRRILDRIVGYKLSPILKLIENISSNSLGAGRVQSVVTRLIVDREKEIEQFLNSENNSVYNIYGDFIINKSKFKANYIHNIIIKEKSKDSTDYKIIKSNIDDINDIKIIVISVRSNPNFYITNLETEERNQNPPQPFITSSLQQESSYKLKFQLKKTMILAQKLYEKGLITYMRTDSPTLSNEALNNIKIYILEDSNLGESYYQFRQFKAKGKNAQEAHEAIRPTHFNIFNLSEQQLNNTDEEKLYQLIWNRTVASQLKPAKYNDQYIKLSNNYNEFEGTNSTLIFDGYLKLYKDIDEEDSKHIKINEDFKKNIVDWNAIFFKETFKSPSLRYNEALLVKKLESLGIGRPSTYASIISKIQEHKYIKVGNIEGIEKKVNTYTLTKKTFDKKITVQKIGNEKLKLLPTSDGFIITEFLLDKFPQIMDYKFTADMEYLLDEIAEGKKIWYEVLNSFYNILKEQLDKLDIKIVQKIENIIIGKHPKYGNIEFMIAKYGPIFKIKYKQKDLFVNAGKIKPEDKDALKNSIKFINYKIAKLQK